MECARFIKLVKSWYLQVQDEALAPARMVTLMKQHVAECRVCQKDPGVGQEVEKITEIVLPPSKAKLLVPKPEPEAVEIEAVDKEPEEEEEGEVRDKHEVLEEEEDEI